MQAKLLVQARFEITVESPKIISTDICLELNRAVFESVMISYDNGKRLAAGGVKAAKPRRTRAAEACRTRSASTSSKISFADKRDPMSAAQPANCLSVS